MYLLKNTMLTEVLQRISVILFLRYYPNKTVFSYVQFQRGHHEGSS